MSFTRAAIKNDISEVLNKTPQTRGAYTDSKMNRAIQQCIDYVATEMFLNDEGWQHKIDYLDTPATGCVKVDVPPHMAMISAVRYLIGNEYVELGYCQEFGNPQWSDSSGQVQFPAQYRIIDNAFYFNPALGTGGSQYLQVEYQAYPRTFLQDADMMDSQFDRAMYWFTVYRACSVLAANIEKFNIPWGKLEAQWYDKMLAIVAKRNQQSTRIRDFEG